MYITECKMEEVLDVFLVSHAFRRQSNLLEGVLPIGWEMAFSVV